MNNKKKIAPKIIKSNGNMPHFSLYFYGIWLLISTAILYANSLLGSIMVGLTTILIIGELILNNKKDKGLKE